MTGRLRAAAAVLAGLVFLGSAAAAEPTRPIGKWERTVEGCRVVLTVEEGRLHVTTSGKVSWTIHADYSMTKDGLLYGVITSADGPWRDLEWNCTDCMFRCRCRLDEGMLIIRDLKVSDEDVKISNEELTGLVDWTGPFKPVVQKPVEVEEESETPPAAGLTDLDGRPWDPARDRKGKLLLLSFWASDDPTSQKDIPDLVELQRLYAPFGLEVLGIAREEGGPLEQVQKVQEVRGHYRINYTTLLAADADGRCPVNELFDVSHLPTLILVDGKGRTLWRGGRLGVRDLWELESEIQRRLGIDR